MHLPLGPYLQNPTSQAGRATRRNLKLFESHLSVLTRHPSVDHLAIDVSIATCPCCRSICGQLYEGAAPRLSSPSVSVVMSSKCGGERRGGRPKAKSVDTTVLFPPIHVRHATGPGSGPRAPPRNKMALYEHVTTPSTRNRHFLTAPGGAIENGGMSSQLLSVKEHVAVSLVYCTRPCVDIESVTVFPWLNMLVYITCGGVGWSGT